MSALLTEYERIVVELTRELAAARKPRLPRRDEIVDGLYAWDKRYGELRERLYETEQGKLLAEHERNEERALREKAEAELAAARKEHDELA